MNEMMRRYAVTAVLFLGWGLTDLGNWCTTKGIALRKYALERLQ